MVQTGHMMKGGTIVDATMVYLRDHELRVDGLAIQGQTFKTTGTVQRDGATWYKIEDRERKQHLISANVVRCMA